VSTKNSRSDTKGRLLEAVVARLQQVGLGDVDMRVRLPASRDPSRTREVDVLVTIPGPLQNLRVPFECRNWARKVGPKDIGEFRDKLDDVGLPVPYGIYVTTTGYTGGATERAKELGIQTLLVKGLTEDRLRVAVHRAMHSTVFVFLSVQSLQPLNERTGPGQQFENTLSPRTALFDEPLELPDGSVPRTEHLLARLADLWVAGAIPKTLGVHGGAFRPPDGFQLAPQMEPLRRGLIWTNLRVQGVLFPLQGTAETLALHDAATRAVKQERLDWQFPDFEGGRSELVFDTEEELADHLRRQEVALHVVARTAVPRVQFQAFWWPVSPEALVRAERLRESGQELTFENVENSSVALGWVEDPRHRVR